jgi:hypothetical protein
LLLFIVWVAFDLNCVCDLFVIRFGIFQLNFYFFLHTDRALLNLGRHIMNYSSPLGWPANVQVGGFIIARAFVQTRLLRCRVELSAD